MAGQLAEITGVSDAKIFLILPLTGSFLRVFFNFCRKPFNDSNKGLSKIQFLLKFSISLYLLM